jgi:hypothetical protein
VYSTYPISADRSGSSNRPGISPQKISRASALSALETTVTRTVTPETTRIFAKMSRERCGSAVSVGWIVPCRYSCPVAKIPMIAMNTARNGMPNEAPPLRPAATVTSFSGSSFTANPAMTGIASEQSSPIPTSQNVERSVVSRVHS